jgi:hypothetical protein
MVLQLCRVAPRSQPENINTEVKGYFGFCCGSNTGRPDTVVLVWNKISTDFYVGHLAPRLQIEMARTEFQDPFRIFCETEIRKPDSLAEMEP